MPFSTAILCLAQIWGLLNFHTVPITHSQKNKEYQVLQTNRRTESKPCILWPKVAKSNTCGLFVASFQGWVASFLIRDIMPLVPYILRSECCIPLSNLYQPAMQAYLLCTIEEKSCVQMNKSTLSLV